jgi:hypothetical protein
LSKPLGGGRARTDATAQIRNQNASSCRSSAQFGLTERAVHDKAQGDATRLKRMQRVKEADVAEVAGRELDRRSLLADEILRISRVLHFCGNSRFGRVEAQASSFLL